MRATSSTSVIHVAHHFEDIQQQREAATIGMWLFLATEVMFFGGLFLGYTVYRYMYPDSFAHASHHLDIMLGGINTAVLICSSLTMALAVWGAQVGSRRTLMIMVAATIAFALMFMIVKTFEWTHKYHDGLIPGLHWTYPPEPEAPHMKMFYVLYFFMTGLHGVHVLIGIGILAWVFLMAWRGKYVTGDYMFVENTGLYWHFVDIIWIFLFPLLYLVDRHAQ